MIPHSGHPSTAAAAAFTRTDLACLLGGFALLASAAVPLVGGPSPRVALVLCANNLQQAGQAFEAFAMDHDDAYPWRVSARLGGSNGSGVAAVHWNTLSNYLPSARILACPGGRRPPAASFAALRNENIGYLIGSDSDPTGPATLVSGDLDIRGGNTAACSYVGSSTVQSFDGTFLAPTTYVAYWSDTNHLQRGNLLTADGSVQMTDAFGLKRVLSRSTDLGNNSHSLIP